MVTAMSQEAQLAELTTGKINDLPDSAFAYIEPGGKKDSEGKTIPRSLRHFPIHDAAHVRNALSRAPQSSYGDKAMPKIKAAAQKLGVKVSATETVEGFPFAEDPEDPLHFGFIVDLENVKLSDGKTSSSWIQAFPVGKWEHPTYGKIEMNLDKAVRMAANVNMGVRGQDLDIDYDHKELRKDAAGWVKQAEARPDGLWLLVDWTREAFQKIKDKAYRYFSPEFSNVWKHSASGQIFRDVLWGGALTNRPHLKGIQPINLSEYQTDEENNQGNNDNPTEMRQLLEALGTVYGVSFNKDTKDADLIKVLAEKIAPKPATPPAPKVPEEPAIAIYMKEDWSSFDLPNLNGTSEKERA